MENRYIITIDFATSDPDYTGTWRIQNLTHDIAERAKELWNSGQLPDFNNDEIIEQETTDISASIFKKISQKWLNTNPKRA